MQLLFATQLFPVPISILYTHTAIVSPRDQVPSPMRAEWQRRADPVPLISLSAVRCCPRAKPSQRAEGTTMRFLLTIALCVAILAALDDGANLVGPAPAGTDQSHVLYF